MITTPSSANQHRCPCGCGASIANTRWSCRAGWYRLPRELRDDIERTRRMSSLVPERRAILNAAIDWYRANPAGGAS